eukprot:GAFH01002409.1.p1 GENE.GAFH01002409.1~~GAFH01002409.1.p1  ORF type:complete len:377 (-),score=60.28 GAFH01002409.1:50-1048(-)
MIRKGIPHQYRPQMWKDLLQYSQYYTPGEFESLLRHAQEHRDEPRLGQALRDVEMDLDRTFPGHPAFASPAGQAALRSVLTALVVLRPEIGYCQGMSFLAATLLLVYPGQPEDAFWTMRLLTARLPAQFYSANMFDVHVEVHVLEDLIQQRLGAIRRLMRANKVEGLHFAVQWYVCLFANAMPMETVFRIWDLVVSEGDKILHRVAIALLKLNRAELLDRAEKKEFILPTLLQISARCYNCETLIKTALGLLNFKRSTIYTLRAAASETVARELNTVAQRRTARRGASVTSPTPGGAQATAATPASSPASAGSAFADDGPAVVSQQRAGVEG